MRYSLRCAMWFAALAALTASAQAQPYAADVAIFAPGPDGVLRLDLIDRCGRRCANVYAYDEEISRSYLRSLDRRRPRKAARAALRKFAQAAPRPPQEVGRSDEPQAEVPRADPQRNDSARSLDALEKLRSEVQRLSAETARLRSDVGALRDELAARRNADPTVTGKLSDAPRPSEPLRKQDPLKSGADEKFAARPPTDVGGAHKQDERFSDIVARAWRRVREMMGRPGN